MKVNHKKYGIGRVVLDIEGICRKGEVLAKFDTPFLSGTIDNKKHPYMIEVDTEIVNECELEYL